MLIFLEAENSLTQIQHELLYLLKGNIVQHSFKGFVITFKS